jgi:sugar lactone lactonase YvrE
MNARFVLPGVLLRLFALVASACTSGTDDLRHAVSEWTLDSASVTIGRNEDSDALLERVTGASVLPDGRILIADLGESPLRIFNSDGSLATRIARAGSGPGEINYLARLFRCGDALFSYDIEGRRIIAFSLDGRYQRELRFAVPEGQQAPYISACNPDGRFAHLGWGTLRPQAGMHRDTVPVWTTTTPDGPPVIFDSIPASERWGQTYQGRVVGTRPLPFGRQPVIGFGRDRILVGSGDTFMVRVYALDGTRVDSLYLNVTAQPVTPADIRDRIERYILERGESERASTERESAEITYPATHAAFTALVVDADDYVWVRPYVAPALATVNWHVFAPDGRHTAVVALPRNLDVFEIGRDYVLGKFLDEVEAQPLVRMYGLRRTPTKRSDALR